MGMRPLDALLGSLRGCLDGFPDKRRGINTTYPMGDIGLAAFSVFFMQSPSFLAHQRRFEAGHGQSNCASLFGIAKIPCDNHIRDMLDPAPPVLLHPVFAAAVDQIRHIDAGLDVFRRLDGRLLSALDGSEYHCSRKIHCQHCSTRLRGKGETEYFHSLLAATLVAPGHDKVMPLEPEFIIPQDGAEKQDCETMAAKRWLAAHGQRYAALNAVYLGDDLFSRQPLCQAVLDAGGHDIALKRQDGAGILRADIARGKAWGALGMGFASRELAERAQKLPAFFGALAAVSQGRLVPAAGGVLIYDEARNILGAVGISGDTSDRDEDCALSGIKAAGLQVA